MKIDLQDVAQELGLQKKGDTYFCPEHDSETPDLHIEKDRFCCFSGKGATGGAKAVSLILHTKDWNSVARAMEWLAERFPKEFGDFDEEELERRNRAKKVLKRIVKSSHEELIESDLKEEIKEGRDLDEEDLERARLGFLSKKIIAEIESEFKDQILEDAGLKTESNYWPLKGRLLIPYLEDGRPVYLIGRSVKDDPEAKYKKLNNTDYNRNILYSFFGESDQLILTEGPFDAISARKAGFDVISPVTNQFSEKQNREAIRLAESYEDVILAFDQDEGGKQGAEKTAEMLLKNGVNPVMLEFPSGHDLDDYTTYNGYDLENLVEEADRYLDRLIEQADNQDREEQRKTIEKILKLIQDQEPAYIDRILKDLPGRKDALEKQLEQIREKNQQESSEKQVEFKEENDLYSTLKIRDTKLKLSPSNRLKLQEHLHTLIELKQDEAGAVQAEPAFNVFSFTFGDGRLDEEFHLFMEADKKPSLGEKRFPIQRVGLENSRYSDALRETFDRLELQQGFQEFLYNFQPAFEKADQLTEESKEKLKELPNLQIREIVLEYLNNGYRIDPTLQQAIYPKLVTHDKKSVRPSDVASFGAHSIIYTCTKTGKSFTAGRVGEIRDKVRVAGLIGYADADGENPGVLDEMAENFFIDELSSGDHEERMNDKILTLMEKGTAAVSQAGRDLTTRFYGSITYLGNPVSEEENSNVSINERFIRITEELGENTEAMGSRIGLVLVDMDMNQVEGQSLPRDRAQKLETLVNWIKAQIAEEYSKIEKQVQSWLESKYPDEYEEKVDRLRTRLYSQKLSEFWKSHKESYRHARGQALRMAVFERIGDVLSKNYSIDGLRELAEQKLKEVMDINLNSLRSMAIMDSQESSEMHEAILKQEEPRYLRYFVYSVIQRSKEENLEKLQTLSSLRETWLEMKEELDEVDSDSKYNKWSPIQKKVEENRHNIQSKLGRRYGIWLEEEQGEILFKISKSSKFSKYRSVNLVDSIIEGDPGHSGNSSSRFSNGRWVKCEECGAVQLATDNYAKCTECGDLLPENDIRGLPALPQPKGAGSYNGGTQHDS